METDSEEKFEYDRYGRMKYNPAIHFNQGKSFTKGDLFYLCKFYEIDGPVKMMYALGRTELVLQQKVRVLKEFGLYNFYKNAPDQLWLLAEPAVVFEKKMELITT